MIQTLSPKSTIPAATDDMFELVLDVWHSVMGEFTYEQGKKAIQQYFAEKPYQPTPCDIGNILKKERAAFLRAQAEEQKRIEEAEYQRELAADKIALAELLERPDYPKLQEDFITKYTAEFPNVEIKPETVDVPMNILVKEKLGFYHFEHKKLGLIDEGHCKFRKATPLELQIFERRKVLGSTSFRPITQLIIEQ